MWIGWILSRWRLLLAAAFLLLLLLGYGMLQTMKARMQAAIASKDAAEQKASHAAAMLAAYHEQAKVAAETEKTLEKIRAAAGKANESVRHEVQTKIVYRDCRVPADGMRILRRAITASGATGQSAD